MEVRVPPRPHPLGPSSHTLASWIGGKGSARPLRSRLGRVLVEGPEDKEDGLVRSQDEVEDGVHITDLLHFNLEVLQNLRKRGSGLRGEAGQVWLPQPRLIHLGAVACDVRCSKWVYLQLLLNPVQSLKIPLALCPPGSGFHFGFYETFSTPPSSHHKFCGTLRPGSPVDGEWICPKRRPQEAVGEGRPSPGRQMSPGQTHVDEEEGHLQLGDPPAHALPHSPAEAQVPEVDEVLVFTQPPGWVKLVRIGEECRVSAHGIDGHLHQCLRTR